MIWYITKTGLEIFDLCRAYGLAALIDFATPEEMATVIIDGGTHYLVENEGRGLYKSSLIGNPGWQQIFADESSEIPWNKVFLTDKNNNTDKNNKWKKKRDLVEKILNEDVEKIISDFQNPAKVARILSTNGETLPGPLEPSAFKGLRGKTRGNYSEGQTKVDEHNWALACLGAVISGRYRLQRAQGNKFDYYVCFPMPQKIEFSNFRAIREATYSGGYKYLSVQNGAAHFSVCLAEMIRKSLASNRNFTDRFSGVLYFSMVQSGKQPKPASGGIISLYPLMELAYSGNPEVGDVFAVWDYLFRIGGKPGNEDVALALTDFITHPSIETYERHTRVFLRYSLNNRRLKREYYYSEKSLMEVIKYVK